MKSYYNYAMLLALMASGGMMGSGIPDEKSYELLTDEQKRAWMQRLKDKQRDVMLKKGLKEFTIDGVTVLALNEKNAKRKVKKYLEMTK
jgi:hypothetical protein